MAICQKQILEIETGVELVLIHSVKSQMLISCKETYRLFHFLIKIAHVV